MSLSYMLGLCVIVSFQKIPIRKIQPNCREDPSHIRFTQIISPTHMLELTHYIGILGDSNLDYPNNCEAYLGIDIIYYRPI